MHIYKMSDHDIDHERKGGQWLMILLEEKDRSPDQKLNIKEFYRSLCEGQTEQEIEAGYKAMMTSVKKELDLLPSRPTVSKFVNG